MAEEGQAYGYGKRPMWQWVLIYLLVGGLVYAAIYYFYIAKKGGYTTNSSSMYATPTPTDTSNALTPAGALYMKKTDSSKGDYLVAANGMTLYIFDKDTKGVSNCYGGCATAWPPYAVSGDVTAENITTVKRTDGTLMYAYKGMPLYYYEKDTKPGDITGDGVGGVWHLVKP